LVSGLVDEHKMKISSPGQQKQQDHEALNAIDTWMSSATLEPSTSLSLTDPSRNIQGKLCSSSFSSRNKLFEHLREEHGHPQEDDSGWTFQNAQSRTVASIEARSKLQNLDYEAYYRLQSTQGNLMSLDDFQTALEYFRRPLPVAFRFLSKSKRLDDVRHEYVRYLRDLGRDGCSQEENTHTQSSLSPILRSSPYFDPLTVQVATIPTREWSEEAQQAFSDAQDVGAANRQELCSMVPITLLFMNYYDNIERSGKLETHQSQENMHDPKNNVTVLDLAAAPGSKTLQLLDMLDSSNAIDFDRTMIVANDSNRNRLLTLARRARLGPGMSCLVLNSSDGRYFPTLRKWGGYKLKFDRILADVPCSGDGTLRKLPSKEWARWTVVNHLQLHKIQVRLLVRSLQLVKKGGRVVYSTCSLDPIENEAVVASAIAEVGGPDVYKIIPIPPHFTLGPKNETRAMNYSPGTSHWVVPDPRFSHNNQLFYNMYDEVPEQFKMKNIVPSMFPPRSRIVEENKIVTGNEILTERTTQNENANQEVFARDLTSECVERRKAYQLTKDETSVLGRYLRNCCRILPQHLDSGGFFCAVIERSSPSFYAICCPRHKGKGNRELSRSFHGRIYQGVAAPQQIREMIARESENEEDCFIEGHSTLEGAIKWLHQHGSFVQFRSERATPMPIADDVTESVDRDNIPSLENMKVGTTNSKPLQPLFTPLFQQPHPQLLNEFCDFYGLCQDSEHAIKAGVERFPVEHIIIVGGGSKSASLTTCMPLVGANQSSIESNRSSSRHQKFVRLALVSREIQSLFAGAAKFNPMEAGLTICWIPLTDNASKASISIQPESRRQTLSGDGTDKSLPRNERSGRYGLADQAAELVGRCATKRVVELPVQDVIQLLSEYFIEESKNIPIGLSAGGVIVRYTIDKSSRHLFFSCKLCQSNKVLRLELLTERRTALGWLRFLQAQDRKKAPSQSIIAKLAC
jgi:16S rRNA C967 or C1407 C5-methylase (RsmB/RsmF family)